jgi:amino acid transporter
MGGATQETSLFVRKATGLVRAWSVFDAFIYAFFSINLVTLGLYSFSLAYGIPGHLVTAVVIGGILTLFECVVYANLIAVMPRAGGDYIWQSRILGGAVGFILAITGWWFILWLWVPLYGQMLVYEFFTPVLGILGLQSAALWFGSSWGLLASSVFTCVFVSVYIGLGMKTYARIQKICFFGGMLGLLAAFVLLLVGSNATFVHNLNAIVPGMFGTKPGANLYQATQDFGKSFTVSGPFHDLMPLGSLALIPLIVFFNLWPNWGATLYGEVRGATDYKRNFMGMASAVIVTMILAVIFFGLIAKTIGWNFYNTANGAFWNQTKAAAPLPFWPYPGLFAAFMVNSPVIQLIVVLLLSLMWFGWSATVFLSSTRVIFAAGFDRLLPEWVADVDSRTRTPFNALLLMTIPGILVSVLYAFNIWSFQTLALDATLVIALTFFGTTLAAVILPWRKRELFEASPVAKMKVSTPLTWLVTALYTVGTVYLVVKSVTDGMTVMAAGVGAGLPTIIAYLVWVLTAVNAVVMLWVVYYVGSRALKGEQYPLVTAAGLVFLGFLDWLLIKWLWDPHGFYGIGQGNSTSMVFMAVMYVLAAIIYFGSKAYRRRQSIDIDKIYQEIPVE